MREYWILSKLQLSSLFGVNQLLRTRSAEEKKRVRKSLWALIAMVFSLGYISVLYSILLAGALRQVGQLPALLGLMTAAASLLILIFSVFETKGVLFGFGDYDTVMSWPAPVSAVAASRVTSMYAYNLVYAALLLLPAGVIYGIYASAAWWFYPLYFALMLFVPALPTLAGAAVGTLVTLLTAGMKKSSVFSAAFQMVFLLAIMVGSMRLNSGLAAIVEHAAELQRAVGSYPPAQWLMSAATGAPGGFTGALLLIGSCVAAMLLFAWLLGKGFVRLNSRLSAVPRGRAYHVGQMRRSGRVRALYGMEWRRYAGSTLYLTNTMFSYVLLFLAALFIGVFRPEAVMQALHAPAFSGVRRALPLMLSGLTVMGATTASAVSIEGKRLWIVKSLPVPARDWLLAKLLVSLTPAAPVLLVCAVLLGTGLNAGAAEYFRLFFTPLCFALFAGVAGLWLNLKLPKLDWKSETEVVKQSAAVMIQVFAGMLVVAAPAAVLIITNAMWVLPLTSAVAAAIAALIWRLLARTADARLYRL